MTRLLNWLEQRLELGRAGASSNLRPMEGLRGLAVFLVFLVHCATVIEPWLAGQPALAAAAHCVFNMGQVGVDLFFVLSGFLIYGALISKPQGFGRFMGRRVRRIYPAFLAVFSLYLLLSVLMPSSSKIPGKLDEAVLYLVENLLLLPGLFPVKPLIQVAWSLSYEFFYYLSIPLVIVLFRLRERSAAWRVRFFLVVTALSALALAFWGGPFRLLMFPAGILLYEATKSSVGRGAGSLQGTLALFAALLLAMPDAPGAPLQTLKYLTLGLLFSIVCLPAFRQLESPLARALSWRPLRWLGNMSYSYYLIHGISISAAMLLISRIWPAPSGGAGLLLAMPVVLFVATLIPSLALFLLVERPFSLANEARVRAASPHPTIAAPRAGVKKKES